MSVTRCPLSLEDRIVNRSGPSPGTLRRISTMAPSCTRLAGDVPSIAPISAPQLRGRGFRDGAGGRVDDCGCMRSIAQPPLLLDRTVAEPQVVTVFGGCCGRAGEQQKRGEQQPKRNC